MDLRKSLEVFLKSDLKSAIKSAFSTGPGGMDQSVNSRILGEVFSSSSYRGSDGVFFWGDNGRSEYHFKYSGRQSVIEAYEKCAPLHSIINRCAIAYISGRTEVLNSQGKPANNGEYAKKLRKLTTQPNPLQSWSQFEAQGYIYKKLFGYNVVLPIKPYGFKENIDSSYLWNIPPYMLEIRESKKIFYENDKSGIIEKIILDYKGVRKELKVEDLLIMKDIQPSFSYISIPSSRVEVLELPINNIIGAYESRNVLINYRGALGILSHDPGGGQFNALPLLPSDKEDLQKEFERYGLRDEQWKFIITSASLKWQQMSIPTKDLMLFEEVESDTMTICDEYNYPYQLLSTAKGTTYSNMSESRKALYQDNIIPEAIVDYEQWNRFFNTEEYNLNLIKGYDHLHALQENELEKMKARRERNEAYSIEWGKGLITRNMWRSANNEPTRAGDDLYIDELQTNSPLAVTLGPSGIQGLILVLTSEMSEEAKKETMISVFGIDPPTAQRMSVANTMTPIQSQQQLPSNNP